MSFYKKENLAISIIAGDKANQIVVPVDLMSNENFNIYLGHFKDK